MYVHEYCRFYLSEIVVGLRDLHELGFVHRDVKPENVLITRTGHIKLVDFGSAARLGTDGRVVRILSHSLILSLSPLSFLSALPPQSLIAYHLPPTPLPCYYMCIARFCKPSILYTHVWKTINLVHNTCMYMYMCSTLSMCL